MQKQNLAELLETEVEQKVTDTTETEHPNSKEIGGVKGPEPTRYGDWEKNGRCVDF